MFCQISGNACSEPVVSKSGFVFERRLIEKHIDLKGQCPVTNQPLSKDDLVVIKSPENETVAPRTAATTSAPSLFKALQVEWDASMLEMHDLKVQNARLQQELASALYNHDAACRVVARLLKENKTICDKMATLINAVQEQEKPESLKNMSIDSDMMGTPLPKLVEQSTDDLEGRDQQNSSPDHLESATKPAGASPDKAQKGVVIPSADIKKQFEDALHKTSERLSATRKQRKTAEMANLDFLKEMKPIEGHETPYMGITHIKIVQPESSVVSHLVIAGRTRGIVLYEYPSLNPVHTWPVKQSKVTQLDVLVHDRQNPVLLIVRKDTVSVVSTLQIIYTATMHEPVTSVTAHPSGEFFATLTASNAIHMHHVASRRTLFTVNTVPADVRSIKFHPDGMLLAAATSSAVHIFSALRGESAAELNNFSAITMMAFSENGFHLATADTNGHVHIWDLRRLLVTFTLRIPKSPTAIKFDFAGNYLAVAHPTNEKFDSSAVSIFAFQCKTWALVGEGPISTGHAHPISDIEWGVNSKSIIIVSPESRQISFIG